MGVRRLVISPPPTTVLYLIHLPFDPGGTFPTHSTIAPVTPDRLYFEQIKEAVDATAKVGLESAADESWYLQFRVLSDLYIYFCTTSITKIVQHE